MTLAQPQTPTTKELVKGLIFHNYAERKPEEGLCIWRMSHKSKKFTIVFTAEMRMRGAGFKDVLSPEFDYWDGYRVILPKGLIEWAEIPAGMTLPRGLGNHVLDIPGVEHENCPFCRSQPKWRSGGFGGYTLLNHTDFHLVCCKWFNGERNRSHDPVALAAASQKRSYNRIMGPYNLFRAVQDQFPLQRALRNFFVTGFAWGLFSRNSHISLKSGKPKVMYNSKSTALSAADSMQKRLGGTFSAYKCAFCDGYHVGRSRTRQEARERCSPFQFTIQTTNNDQRNP